MKTQLISLSVVALLWMASSASAAIFVHAGPVHVGIRPSLARPVYRHWHAPVIAHRPVGPVVRPVIAPVPRPVAPVIRPVIAPAPRLSPAAAALRAARIRHAIQEEVQKGIENALNNQ
ncbi:MAG: hypothetical protein ACWGMZ_02040 [Thermoguttaceae bacterium]